MIKAPQPQPNRLQYYRTRLTTIDNNIYILFVSILGCLARLCYSIHTVMVILTSWRGVRLEKLRGCEDDVGLHCYNRYLP